MPIRMPHSFQHRGTLSEQMPLWPRLGTRVSNPLSNPGNRRLGCGLRYIHVTMPSYLESLGETINALIKAAAAEKRKPYLAGKIEFV